MHAVASVGADRRHPRARADRDGWLGRGRDRLLLRREGWPASVPDRRRRSAGGARFGPCRATDVRAYPRQTHGDVGLLAGWAHSALDRHCRAALRAGSRNPRRRGNRTGQYRASSSSRLYPDITFELALPPETLDAARQIVDLCDFVPPEDAERNRINLLSDAQHRAPPAEALARM